MPVNRPNLDWQNSKIAMGNSKITYTNWTKNHTKIYMETSPVSWKKNLMKIDSWENHRTEFLYGPFYIAAVCLAGTKTCPAAGYDLSIVTGLLLSLRDP